MAFEVFKSSDQTATFFLCIFTTPICVLLTLLRFTTTQRRGRNIGLEDWLALAALIIFLVWVGYALAGKSYQPFLFFFIFISNHAGPLRP